MFSVNRSVLFSATLGAVLAILLLNKVVTSQPVDSIIEGVSHETRSPGSSEANAHYEKFNDEKYEVIPLVSGEQGSNSNAFTVVGGYKGRPAILKIVKLNMGIDTDKESDYLDRVDLLLDDEEDEGKHYFMIKNVREDYPEPGSPPLKPFHEWYLKNPKMNVEESLEKMYTIVKARLRDFAFSYSLLYYDFHLENFFVDEHFTFVMPIDWAPPRDVAADERNRPAGVVDITGLDEDSDSSDDEQWDVEEQYYGHLEKDLKAEFTPDALNDVVSRVQGGSAR